MFGYRKKSQRRFITLLSILIIITFGFSDEINDLYKMGMDALRSGQNDLTIQEFERILLNGWESPQIYYNLGNAYYRNGSVAGSIWAYEQCLLLDPIHRDAKYNLGLANLKVKDRVDIPEPPFYLKVYQQIKVRYTSLEWLVIFSGLLLTISLLMAIRKIFRYLWFRKIEIGLIIFLIMVVLIGINAVWDKQTSRQGITYHSPITALSGPDEYSTKLFEIHEGLKVNILDETEGWIEIGLINGNSGWIPSTQIRKLQN